jgi:hypothetical protein
VRRDEDDGLKYARDEQHVVRRHFQQQRRGASDERMRSSTTIRKGVDRQSRPDSERPSARGKVFESSTGGNHHDPECAVVIGKNSKELIRTERLAHGWANAADVPRPAIATTSPPYHSSWTIRTRGAAQVLQRSPTFGVGPTRTEEPRSIATNLEEVRES